MKLLFRLTDISNIKRVSFRQDINGLRAIAVLAVVFYHADIKLFKGGWLGVDIFFVISGYLISNIIISELNEGTFSFKNFYLRRVRRILPALFSTLLLTIPFAYFFLTPKAMTEYINSLVASIFFYANYHFMNLDFYVAESTKVMPLLHTWSLAIEEQYYLLFPLLAFAVYKYYKKYFAFFIALITFASIYINSLTQSTDKFYRLEFRIWELLLGVLVMILSSNYKVKHLEKIGLPLMLFPIFYFGDEFLNHAEPKLISLIGISLIILSNTDFTVLTRILSYKIISTIGLCSYSIYLLHQPIFAFYRIFRNNFDLISIRYLNLGLNNSIDVSSFPYFNINNLSEYNYTIVNLLLLSCTLCLGYISYKFVEVPSIKNKNFIPQLSFFLLLSAFIIHNGSSALENNYSNELTEESVFSDYNCWQKYGLEWDNFEPLASCTIDNNSNKDLIILGDSSSASISKNVIQKNLFSDYNIYFISVNYDDFFIEFNSKLNCNNCFLTWIQDNPSTIIVSVELHRYIEKDSIYYTDEFSNQNVEIFKNNMKYLSKFSNDLLIIEPFPTVPQTMISPRYLLELDEKNEIQEIYISYSTWIQNAKYTIGLLDELQNDFDMKIVRTNELFCSSKTNKCLFYKDTELLYLDEDHLSIAGGNLITKRLEIVLGS